GGANRVCLDRIMETGNIFFAISDRDWVLDGANVHISMVGFDDGAESTRTLDGESVRTINPNLSATANTTKARLLAENREISFIGTMKKAPLDIDESLALAWVGQPNVHGRPNSDVLRPWMNGLHLTQRAAAKWIIDYPADMTEEEAAKYSLPFEYVVE